ncbi:MAG TPA: PIN domain-containing protein [Chitinophagaceae bacterium]|nr:PIN domain-containing protein [Chitinophagaceae bacterium]
MHKILVDTCVWLDMAKDPEQQALLNVIEELVKRKELTLIVPRVVVQEFERNKEKIIKESSQSLSSVFKRVKNIVDKFGDPKKKKVVLEQLDNVDYKIPSLGESAITSVKRIEKLLKKATIIETTDDIKLKAAQRAIEKKAPFHRQKNSINDALIIEIYSACIQNNSSTGIRFAFVTHNKNDFSLPNGNDKIPHPDLAMYFSKIKSKYYIKLAEAVHRIRPDLVTDIMIEEEWFDEPRSLTEILKAEEEFFDRIWYDRKIVLQARIKEGLEKESPPDIKKGMLASMKRVEAKYGGRAAMRKYYKDDFEWGMLNGKLSALRWVIGEEWDNLDT